MLRKCQTFLGIGFLLLGLLVQQTAAGSAASEDTSTPFLPSDNRMADVDAVLAKAAESEKLALIALGATWCHDSMGFFDHTKDPDVSRVLAEKYEILWIDVGYLEHGKDVMERFGKPVIYGTPTVLIVDPDSNTLLNADSAHIWRESAAMSSYEVAEKLSGYSKRDVTTTVQPPQLQLLLDEIKGFEEAQAKRIYRGFEIIGPMLAGERSDDFYSYWTELRTLRYQITKDLAALRAEAARRVSAGETSIDLTYPDYPAFSWEE